MVKDINRIANKRGFTGVAKVVYYIFAPIVYIIGLTVGYTKGFIKGVISSIKNQ